MALNILLPYKYSMGTIKDLTNQRFGRLLAIKISHKTERKRCVWLCNCDCGNQAKVTSSNLIHKKTTSCGCYHKEIIRKTGVNNRLKYGEATFNVVYGCYRYEAKKRNVDFNLNKDEFKNIIFKNCHYCNIEPYQIKISENGTGDTVYNGIDRIDNNVGYMYDNCVPCCGQCNRAKYQYTVKEFLSWVKRLHEYQNQ